MYVFADIEHFMLMRNQTFLMCHLVRHYVNADLVKFNLSFYNESNKYDPMLLGYR
jgi:hypothetical protein